MSSDDTTGWDHTADVVIVGFGVAGAAAAIEALDGGASVLALDRYTGGGATAISGGVVYAGGGTSVQAEAGITDTVDAMEAYLRTEVGDAVSPDTLREFCEQSPAMIEWLRHQGVPFGSELCPFKSSYPNDDYFLYYSGSEATGRARAVAAPAPRGHRARGTGTSGKKLYEPMATSALWKGLEFHQHTRVTGLVREGERVVGVEALTLRGCPASVWSRYTAMAHLSAKPGVYSPQLRASMQKRLRALEDRWARPVRVRAEKGVVLAGGGFYQNRAMVKENAPHFRGGLPLGTAGDDGAVITLGREAGGAVAKMDKVSAWRFITPPSAVLGSLLVGRDGVRRGDESRYGATLGVTMVTEQEGRGWLLVDQKILAAAREQLRTQPLWFQRIQAVGMLRFGATSGDTIAEVAEKVGIDVHALQRTVGEHNAAIADGREDPTGKTDDVRVPVDTPPYSLLDVSIKQSNRLARQINPCPMISLGGLVVDERSGGVRARDGSTIDGLYAIGRSAVGICSNGYVSGLSLADCIYSGRRAGRHLSR